MTRAEFLMINDQPCRFKLKTGKEIFGVIWENAQPGNSSYYFATLNERFNRNFHGSKSVGMMIDLQDVVGAELLSNSGTLVG